MVVMLAAVHTYALPERRGYSRVALAFAVLTAGR